MRWAPRLLSRYRSGRRFRPGLNAGIGKDEAGVSGLPYADTLGMAMATVATASARIGDGQDLYARGIISHANTLDVRWPVRRQRRERLQESNDA